MFIISLSGGTSEGNTNAQLGTVAHVPHTEQILDSENETTSDE
ncbi:hypothetical protein [Methanosalsum zhilinae]|nr:hypothetical protein [Methanosalsum zhilinae]